LKHFHLTPRAVVVSHSLVPMGLKRAVLRASIPHTQRALGDQCSGASAARFTAGRLRTSTSSATHTLRNSPRRFARRSASGELPLKRVVQRQQPDHAR
jgi:hypothetical protein